MAQSQYTRTYKGNPPKKKKKKKKGGGKNKGTKKMNRSSKCPGNLECSW